MIDSNGTYILCLDLALTNTGCAVIQLADKDKLIVVKTIRTVKLDKETLKAQKLKVADDDWRRTKELSADVAALIKTYPIKHVFIECPTGGSKSAFAAKAMALAKGTLCGTLTLLDIPSTLITPFAAKKAATGNSEATKTEVKNEVLKLFPDFTGWVKNSAGKLLIGQNEHIFDAVSVYIS